MVAAIGGAQVGGAPVSAQLSTPSRVESVADSNADSRVREPGTSPDERREQVGRATPPPPSGSGRGQVLDFEA